MNLDKSKAIFSRANRFIPGGVNSPVRAYATVGGTPPHIKQGKGPLVWDEDGNEFVDLVLSYGPLILGHGNQEVREVLHGSVDKGTAFGAPTLGELQLAETICERVPTVEMVRLVNSGTEATISATRLARAATGRDHIVKFNGCYHGHGDSFLVRAGSGGLTFGAPDSPGVPASLAELTLVAEYNDLKDTAALFERPAGDIAAIIVEPVAGNMGLIPPQPGFLEGLRDLCDAHGALLIFDEVMTGFRVAAGGYQQISSTTPDLTCMGKVIGGGLPIGAYGGRRDLMEMVSPAGDVYQAGTLSGNPLAVAAGNKTLEILGRNGTYEGLEEASEKLAAGIEGIFNSRGRAGLVQRQGSMMCLYLSETPVHNLEQVHATDRESWVAFFGRMLEQGILLPPSPYEAWFLSTEHSDAIVSRILEAVEKSL